MRQCIVFIIFVLLTPSLAKAEVELKGSPGELSRYLSSLPKEISLTGEAKLDIPAESGIVTIGIKTESSQLQKSLQNNQSLKNEIITHLISNGISNNRIKGTKFSSTPEYGFFGKKPNNYVVENRLKIIVESEKELQAVAEVVDSFKDVFYQGLELKEQEKEVIKKKLLDLALADANTRKSVYEKEFGVTLLPVTFFENIFIDRPVVRQRHVKQSKMLYDTASNSASSTPGVSFGEHTYEGRVEIQYRVIQNHAK